MNERFETDRLVLRSPRHEDDGALTDAILESLDELDRHFFFSRYRQEWSHAAAGLTWAQSFADLFGYDAPNEPFQPNKPFHIFAKSDGQLVGACSLHTFKGKRAAELPFPAQVWGWVRDSRQRQGFGTELFRALIRFGFQALGAQEIWYCCATRNVPSQKTAQKLGLSFEGPVFQYASAAGVLLPFPNGPNLPVYVARRQDAHWAQTA